MVQEEKQQLLKDLCTRLHYGVRIKTSKGDGVLCSIDYIQNGAYLGISINGEVKDYYEYQDTKPYLRPISSMTEVEWLNLQEWIFIASDTKGKIYFGGFRNISAEETVEAIDYLISHHFDYRGLIEKGLALEAPDDMYKTE